MNDLWQVYFADEEYCKLSSRKKSLRRLFEQCREFQMNSEAFLNVYKNPDASIPEDIRVVNEDDLERIDGITTFEELKDMVVCTYLKNHKIHNINIFKQRFNSNL